MVPSPGEPSNKTAAHTDTSTAVCDRAQAEDSAKPYLDFLPTENMRINTCCFESLNLGVSFKCSNI